MAASRELSKTVCTLRVALMPAKVGQILIEIHPKRIKDFEPPEGKDVEGGQMILKYDRLQRNLEKHGYRMFSMEPAASTNTSQVELSFIHKDWTPLVDAVCDRAVVIARGALLAGLTMHLLTDMSSASSAT